LTLTETGLAPPLRVTRPVAALARIDPSPALLMVIAPAVVVLKLTLPPAPEALSAEPAPMVTLRACPAPLDWTVMLLAVATMAPVPVKVN